MPIATWTYETIPGGSWTYNQTGITYNDSEVFDGAGTVRYDQIGEITNWTNENK